MTDRTKPIAKLDFGPAYRFRDILREANPSGNKQKLTFESMLGFGPGNADYDRLERRPVARLKRALAPITEPISNALEPVRRYFGYD